MIKNSIRNEKVVEISFLSLILVFLDSYEFMKFPLTWIGNLMIVTICIFIFIKKNANSAYGFTNFIYHFNTYNI